MTYYILIAAFIVLFIVMIISGTANKRKAQKAKQSMEKISKENEKTKTQNTSKSIAKETSKEAQQEKNVETLRYFCMRDNGSGYISVWPKNQKIPNYLEFNIAGTNFRKGLSKYTGEFKGKLEEEPTNEYDPSAIKILAEDGHHIGYVPKDMTNDIRKFMPLPCACYCYLHQRNENGKQIYFGSAYITTEPPKE